MIVKNDQNSIFCRMFSTAGKQRQKHLQMLKNSKSKRRSSKTQAYLNSIVIITVNDY